MSLNNTMFKSIQPMFNVLS